MTFLSWERPLPHDGQDFVLKILQDDLFQQINLFKLPAALPKKAESHQVEKHRRFSNFAELSLMSLNECILNHLHLIFYES